MYFRGRYKSKQKVFGTSKTMGKYTPTEEEMKAAGWCITHGGIKISVHFPEPMIYQLCVTINGKEHIDPKEYEPVEIWKKMYEYYKYYYEKHISKRK